MDNVLGAIEIPLALFSGLNTELSPVDVPEGVSPGNQDVVYLPGSVQSRPGMHRYFSSPFPSGTTVNYQKTFLQPNGNPLNLYLTSDGQLWKEDVVNTPGTVTLISKVPPGSYAQSVTAFGREYIAFSDGKHGTTAPFYFDGTNFIRVTQDGPGAAPTVADHTDTVTITRIDIGGGLPNPQITLASAQTHPPVIVGDAITISGNAGNLNNGTGGNPANWFVTAVIDTTHFQFGIPGIVGGTGGTGGSVVIGGQSSPGLHLFVQFFQTFDGTQTRPSRYVAFNSSGNTKYAISNLAEGPPNIFSRVVGATGAGGANFFYIPVPVFSQGQQIATSTLTYDNPSSGISYFMDFSDTTLLNATAIDVPGNDLFNMDTVSPALGMYSYADRLMVWGTDNKITNFLNMGFDGGALPPASDNTPSGWVQDISGGNITQLGVEFGFGFAMTGVGSPNCLIHQGAYQDQSGVAIIQPNTSYLWNVYAKIDTPGTGFILCDLYDPSVPIQVSVASIPLTSLSTTGKFYQVAFNNITGDIISPTLILRVYCSMSNGAVVTIDDMSIVPAEQPYRNDMQVSYVIAPGQFDLVTGVLAPATDPTPVKCCTILRDTLRIKTSGGMHTTNDSPGSEPSGWTINTFSRTVGAVSFRAGDPGRFGTGDTAEDWDLTASKGGLYIDFGGELFKISQEIQTVWDSINWAAQHTIWLKNDPIVRRAYIGVPTGGNITPNQILVMDYRELDTAYQISTSAPIHISFTGKMISSDLARKWTIWNLAMASAEVLDYAPGFRQLFLGSGNTANNNTYYLDPLRLTDDDFGQIIPYYITYAFLNHEAEVALGTGLHRKLYNYLTVFATGTGNMNILPMPAQTTNTSWGTLPPSPSIATGGNNYVVGDVLTVAQAGASGGQVRVDHVNGIGTITALHTVATGTGYVASSGVSLTGGSGIGATLTYTNGISVPLISSPLFDYEFGVNVLAERCFFKVSVTPQIGQTDVQFNINKLICSLRQDAWSPVRGAF